MRISFPVILLFFLATTAFAQNLPPLDGLAIATKQEASNIGYGSDILPARMKLSSATGQNATREMIIKTREEQQGDKSLIKFLAPADIMGTSLLSFQNKNRSDDQWLYLPALKKTKRIAGTSKGGAFVGSDFSYEDLVPFAVDKYTYTFLREDVINGKPCYVNAASPKDTSSVYSKTVSWIDGKNFQTLKAEFYDKKNRHIKTAVFSDIRSYAGHFFRAKKIIMTDLRKGSLTELDFGDIRVSAGLKTDDFTERALTR